MAVRDSNPLFLEVLEALPVQGLPIEVDIYDGDDPATMMATIEGARDVGWTDPFGDVGAGSFLLQVADPKATGELIRSGNLVKLKLGGIYRYAYWIENPKVIAASIDGVAGKVWTVAGRGREAYLERVGTYPPGWPIPTAQERVYTDATFGEVLKAEIDLAQARGGLPDLTYDFTDTLDSQGQAWDSLITLTIRSGISLLDLWKQLIGLGMESRMTTDLKLQAFVSAARQKEDEVIFREGYHLRDEVVRELQDASLRTRVLVEGADGHYAEASDPVLEGIPRIGRREGFVSFTQSADPTTLQRVADQMLATFSDQTEAISVPVSHGPADQGHYEPYVDYRNGDWIGLDIPGFYDLQPYRVLSTSVRQREGGGYDVDLDLNSVAVEHIVTLKRMIDALAGGSSASGAAGSGTVSGTVGPGAGGSGRSDGRVAVEFGDSPAFLADKIEGDGGTTVSIIGPSGNRVLEVSSPIPPVEIDDLDDVDTTTVAPTNGQALVWNSTLGLWVPGTVGGGGGGGGGATIIGTSTVGTLFYSPPADNRGQGKKVAIPAAGMILGVSGYFRMVGGPGTGALIASVYTDNAGSPAKPMAGYANTGVQVLEAANTDLGWFYFPMNVYVPSAQDVWIVVGNIYQSVYLRLAYENTGSDREFTFNVPWLASVGSGYTTHAATTRDHSIRCHFLAD